MYLDLEFFDGETFDCYQVFQNSALIDFMSQKLPYFLELVNVFYTNLKIQDGIFTLRCIIFPLLLISPCSII